MLDPQLTSPYMVRFTNVSAAHADTTADWAIKQGMKKMVIVTYDTAAGVETGDLVGSAFVSRGGQVVQEMHPPFGTTDFGPYLAKLDQSADMVAIWEPASDGVHFLEQFANYAGQKKQVVVDMGGAATGDNLDELGDRAVGVVVETTWADGLDNPHNQAFMKAFTAKNPKKSAAPILVNGWTAGAILESALKTADGKVEDNPSFLQAVYGVNVQTAAGNVNLDPSTHDVVRSYYITKVAKRGNGTYGYDVMATYDNVSQFWDRKPEDLRAFPYGKLKDQWNGMTRDKLSSLHGLTGNPS
jgi:branched-chain amino acid transport system substrate-binding protein